ncbi:TetR family transcriptional regulator [Streptomyces himalayensis]|uniref:TetR family transcriptional regulator n=1 Tax=Streptomyces himalayensis subsp. himalayensis TaxID=2756131 RepID=A0A7W0DGN2_9ACTN|nr:TetR family transcriptional regulator [Streptomyces himalayensis]MBA2944680.1 TetR family transcriptional regulator [Streptomyces himalayensis subsp. himalayensis]
MSHIPVGIRQTQKRKTRQALLDAALELLEGQSLSSLGLREVTRAVGIAPTAFYRHFRSTADLGVALVEEALGSLHEMIGTTLAATGDSDERIARTVDLIAVHVGTHAAHVRFIARERHGGVQPVRAAIGEQLDRFAEEVAVELAAHPESKGWSEDDMVMLARLYVDHMVMTASAFLDAEPGNEERVASLARRQMRLVSLGRRHWLD